MYPFVVKCGNLLFYSIKLAIGINKLYNIPSDSRKDLKLAMSNNKNI